MKLKPDSKEIKTNIEILFADREVVGLKKGIRKQIRIKTPKTGKKRFYHKPDKMKEDQKKYKDKKMSKKNVEKILNELKNRNRISVRK